MGGAGDGAARLKGFGGLPRILRQDLPQFHFAASVYACLDEDRMPKTVRVVVLSLVVGSAGIPTITFAQSEGLSLKIELRNDAKFRRNAIEGAQTLVNGIYAHTGVQLIWTNQDPQLTVVLKRSVSADITHRAQDAMGFTPGTDDVRGRLAFVLINRVNEVAQGYRVSPFVVLGAAIAHELGHLLTTKEYHLTGLMQPYFNQSDFRNAREGRLLFTREQAEAVRQKVRTLATP
jgi:hypothetical protein